MVLMEKELVINHDVVDLVRQRLKYFGHVVDMMSFRTPNVLLYRRAEGRRPVGRPRKRWLDVVGEDCKLLGITLQEADQLARNRVLWSRSVSIGCLSALTLWRR